MKHVVWKYAFPRYPADETTLRVDLPAGSTPRLFAFQAERPTVWVEVVDGAEGTETWTFVVVGTGHALPPGAWQYVGSALVSDGAYVFHGYARREPA